jgi:hypothetical protein
MGIIQYSFLKISNNSNSQSSPDLISGISATQTGLILILKAENSLNSSYENGMVRMGSVSVEDVHQILAEVNESDAAKRIMAAITYKETNDLTQTDAAELDGFSSSWASKWFTRPERLADEPFEEVVYNRSPEGGPSELSDKEHGQFLEAFHDSPEEVGHDAPAWSVPLARHYLSEEFGVEHCERHVR